MADQMQLQLQQQQDLQLQQQSASAGVSMNQTAGLPAYDDSTSVAVKGDVKQGYGFIPPANSPPNELAAASGSFTAADYQYKSTQLPSSRYTSPQRASYLPTSSSSSASPVQPSFEESYAKKSEDTVNNPRYSSVPVAAAATAGAGVGLGLAAANAGGRAMVPTPGGDEDDTLSGVDDRTAESTPLYRDNNNNRNSNMKAPMGAPGGAYYGSPVSGMGGSPIHHQPYRKPQRYCCGCFRTRGGCCAFWWTFILLIVIGMGVAGYFLWPRIPTFTVSDPYIPNNVSPVSYTGSMSTASPSNPYTVMFNLAVNISVYSPNYESIKVDSLNFD
ncbi:hypothetical protein HDU76_008931, partial [Blyttiomyces sp. JEL0837]